MSDFIQFSTISVDLPYFDQDLIRKWISSLVQEHNQELGELNYYFCDDKKILEANQEYLEHDYFTDVITFDLSIGTLIMGDVLISLETVASNALLFEVSFEQELMRVMAHAVLHLLGFKDKTEEEQKEMTEQEDKALSLLEKLKLQNAE